MPKDNEVDEKVIEPVAVIYPDTGLRNDAAAMALWRNHGYDTGGEPLYSAATVAELRADVERLVKALDEAACELSAAGQALAEFEGFEFRQKAAIDRAYAASRKAHDANGYTEVLTKVTP